MKKIKEPLMVSKQEQELIDFIKKNLPEKPMEIAPGIPAYALLVKGETGFIYTIGLNNHDLNSLFDDKIEQWYNEVLEGVRHKINRSKPDTTNTKTL